MANCYRCGQTATSREHYPPKAHFPKNSKLQLKTVPSCDLHNTARSGDDQYFLAHIAMNCSREGNLARDVFMRKVLPQVRKSGGYAAVLINGSKTLGDGTRAYSINVERRRKQTKKYRPIVPLTETLRPFVCDRNVERFVLWNKKPIKSVRKTFTAAVSRAGLTSEIQPYSLRHTMATELRSAGVSPWEIEGLLGHKRPTTSEKYARFEPSFLSQGRQAIDAYFKRLDLYFINGTVNSVATA